MSENQMQLTRSAVLLSEVSKQVQHFGKDRRTNKRKAFWLRILGTIFSAITTILLGLQGVDGWSVVIKNFALFLSAFVTVISAWDSFYNHRGLWIHYKAIHTKLETLEASLKYLIASAGGDEPSSDEVDRLFKRFEEIIEQSTRSWLELRNEGASQET